MDSTNNIFDRLSPVSVDILRKLNSSVMDEEDLKAGDIVNEISKHNKAIAAILKTLDVSKKLSKRVKLSDWLVNAYHEAYLSNSEMVDVDHLALSLLLDISTEKYYKAKKKIPSSNDVVKTNDPNKYFEDVSEIVAKSKVKYVGRERELTNLIVNLASGNVRSLLLVGESGSGKTELIYELARRIKANRVPENLLNTRIIRIKFSTLLTVLPMESGHLPNAFLSQLFSHIASAKTDKIARTILFLDDLHFGTSFFVGVETVDSNSELLLIGAANDDINDKFWDSPMSKMWDVIELNSQRDEDYRKILTDYAKSKSRAEKGALKYSDTAISKVIEISKSEGTKEVLPGVGIKMLDSLAVYKRHINADYERVKSKSAGSEIVIDKIDVEEFFATASNGDKDSNKHLDLSAKRLLNLEEELSKSIIGQDKAVKALSRALRVSSLKLTGSSRPIGTFLFLGPTGVGKTETAKVLAKSLFGMREGSKNQPANFIRIDMTEFGEKHNVSKLFGAPPGYIGYDEGVSLCDFVLDNPSCVVLFDEIDKAHPEVLNSLLHIMDEGELRNNTGEIVSFENVIILMTSNHGAELINEEGIGFGSQVRKKNIDWHQKLLQNLKKQLKPEFINRFDEVIVFDQLNQISLELILQGMLEPISENLTKRNIAVRFNKGAQKLIVQKSNTDEYGARELRRVLNREVIDPISKIIFKDSKVKKIKVKVDDKDAKSIDFTCSD